MWSIILNMDVPEGLPIKDSLQKVEKNIESFCRDLHVGFDNKWKAQTEHESFHNWSHVTADWQAADILIDQAFAGVDPLHLLEGLAKWNASQTETKNIINLENKDEIKAVFHLAIYLHDLGNIAVFADNNEGFVLREAYAIAGAEGHSRAIARRRLAKEFSSEGDYRKYARLIDYLIGETIFFSTEESKKIPDLALFMRVIDQLSNDSFSENGHLSEGILWEKVGENENDTVIPYNAFNFTLTRAPELFKEFGITEQNTLLQQIFTAWGKPPLKETLKYGKVDLMPEAMKKKMKTSDLLKMLGTS